MNLDEILSQLPMDQIAGQLGVDPETAQQATRVALPALLGGMQANAQDSAGAASLTKALGQHQDDLDDEVISGRRGIDQIDTNDGDRIVSNVFGQQQDQVVNRLAGASQASSGLIAKLLPILAPMVMSYLAKRVLGGGASAPRTTSGGGLGPSQGGGPNVGGIDVADILGQVLAGRSGGESRQAGPSAGGIDLGDLLGGLLGGGRR